MGGQVERPALGARIKDAREYAGFSQEDVAKYLGLTRSAVSLIESGSRRLEALELQKLAKLFDCSMEALTGEDEASTRPQSLTMIARAAASLKPEDQAEVLRFAEYLRMRSGSEIKK